MDVTQILLALVGAIASWALGSVVSLREKVMVLDSQIKGMKEGLAAEKADLNRRLDDLKKSVDGLAKIFNNHFHRRATDGIGDEDET